MELWISKSDHNGQTELCVRGQSICSCLKLSFLQHSMVLVLNYCRVEVFQRSLSALHNVAPADRTGLLCTVYRTGTVRMVYTTLQRTLYSTVREPLTVPKQRHEHVLPCHAFAIDSIGLTLLQCTVLRSQTCRRICSWVRLFLWLFVDTACGVAATL